MSLKPRHVDFDETWGKIHNTLRGVITLGNVTRAEWNERFSDVYAICVASPDPLGDRLYKVTKEFFETHVQQLFKSTIGPSTNLLQDYQHHWNLYSQGSKYVNMLYRYLNNQHNKKRKQEYGDHMPIMIPSSSSNNEMVEIGQLALEIWKKGMIDPLQECLVKAILEDITRDRDGEAPSQTVLNGVIHSFIEVQDYETRLPLKLYQEIFESQLLSETGEYYQKEANQLLEYCNCSQYMQKVDIRLVEENMRARKFIHPTSYDKVVNVCQGKLVEDHLSLLQAECKQMVKEEKLSDLSRMYKLLKPIVTGLSVMLKEFEEYIADTGLASVKALYTENGTGQFVDALLSVHKKYTDMIESTFASDQSFLGARDKACTKIVNHKVDSRKPCRSPELLAKYCDSLLKKSTKNLTEQEIDDKLNNVIVIFKYIDDKDVFQKFYAKLLAKRLIHNMSVSMDSEESMINRLKLACGYEYTNKLHRMFTDMKISDDLNKKFVQFLGKNNTDVGISFSLLVLQSGAWPLGQTSGTSVSFPNELVKSVQMFETFYNGIYNGRKLAWLQHLSNGEVKLTYLKKPYIVTVTTYQMAILLLFNESDCLSFSDISNQSQLAEKELARTVQSLLDVKIMENVSKSAADLKECNFSLNMEFTNKRTKFKITGAVQKETVQELEQTHTAVDEDRKMYIQATIVRVMKSRKILKHNILIQEIISQAKARFSPSISLIKKCIEALIDKQYIERCQGTKDEYSYVA